MLTYDELRDVAEAVMSGRKTPIGPLDDREERIQARPGDTVYALAPNADGAPASENGAPSDDSLEDPLEISPFTWGFEAPWSKGLIFNTRIESALDGSRMWAGPILNGRCILPVATFFEPHGTETQRSPRTGRPMKRQYEFASPTGGPLLLASVQQEGRLSVVTTEPNDAVSPIHKRMPLALRFEEVFEWLAGDYAALTDRTGFDLLAYPENGADEADEGGKANGQPSQLSLF